MPALASHIASVPPSGIRSIFEIALQFDDVISLAVGEPDVPVAPHILEAGAASWLHDDTNYSPNGGIAALRAAVVAKLARENDIVVDSERVWITTGGTQALHLAMSLTLGQGDEILVPDPGYTVFTMSPRLLDATPVPYSLRPEHGFAPDLDELERLITDRTRVLVVNSPSNPLGTVFAESMLRSLLEFAKRHDLWVISDEVYEYFTYDAPHVSLASLDDEDRVFSVFSLSKTYALTGVRVGYLVTPPGLAPILRSAQETTIGCVNLPAQHAAIAALLGDHQHVADARAHYRGNLAAACALLDERGIAYLEPEGAFYLWIDLRHDTDGDVHAWAERFVIHERVAVAPGSAFGRLGEGWIRVCVAADRDRLLEGLGRLPSPK